MHQKSARNAKKDKGGPTTASTANTPAVGHEEVGNTALEISFYRNERKEDDRIGDYTHQ